MSATGDAKLTMLQQVPLDGTIIVSTPQDMALINARRGIAMFHRGNVPVLGAVENMSTFICPKCGTRFDILGHGGARQEAERLGVPLLGGVPPERSMRETSDTGLPIVATNPTVRRRKPIAPSLPWCAISSAGAAIRPAPKIVIEA